MPPYSGPLIGRPLLDAMHQAHAAGGTAFTASFDLGRSQDTAQLAADGWQWRGQRYPWPQRLKDRTLYYWDGHAFMPAARFGSGLYKLVPTGWDVPTFEIDGIKMLPTARTCPLEDARRKVALVAPQGRQVLDTCGGLGYFAACCLEAGAAAIRSYEKSPEVLWLRTLNPWSPDLQAEAYGGRLTLVHDDVSVAVATLAEGSFDAVLHDPPRFGIAGELYSQAFYDQLARVLRKGGRLFHYTGTPNRLTSGRDVPREVGARLEKAGFRARPELDGVFAIRR
ncbi:class I SAM-dependent methyltransferase [Stenotrophomonas mori]|uniref:SAM-dependent methyltransferase n=1 Tax=Stenotrophomonas mori TaxID=2871096 RepID=A0ABT0SK98_9GAMM|nr:SAM-dependent methyltransferase [Stenotrophomonas mori]MCL7715324.1 SAM-dependent methyltransferase [Stenotrophomonas mori]